MVIKFEDKSPDEKVILAEKLVDIGKKRLKLYMELEESLRYERCDFHVVQMPDTFPKRYILIEIKTKKELAYGPPDRIHTILERRGVKDHQVYNLKVILNVK